MGAAPLDEPADTNVVDLDWERCKRDLAKITAEDVRWFCEVVAPILQRMVAKEAS